MVLVGICVFAILFASLLSLYHTEGTTVEESFFVTNANQASSIEIYAKIITIDPIKGELVARLQFSPQGDLLSDDGVSVAKDVELEVNSETGKMRMLFKQGERMNPVDVVLSVYGSLGNYPFDQHQTVLTMHLATQPQDTTSPNLIEPVPSTVSVYAAVVGYPLHVRESVYELGYSELTIEIQRSIPVKIFSVFIMLLQWLLALSALSVTLACLKGRKVEVSMFGWMGALLFAMVPLRNAMPAVPPVGVLSDFVSFFWAIIMVALSLVVMVGIWIVRPAPK
ncbi:MAG TPA: DUF4436 family protein [Anaerolineales bacterium]|nr:DUF4436 family protein [Anaerolineales bacterium]